MYNKRMSSDVCRLRAIVWLERKIAHTGPENFLRYISLLNIKTALEQKVINTKEALMWAREGKENDK